MGHSREKDVMLVRLFGDRSPPSVHNAHRERGNVRDGSAKTRKLAHRRKGRKGIRLNLHLEGRQMTCDAKENLIKDIIGEKSALPQT